MVVDYKTDALRGADPAELAKGYATQRDLYALAVHGARGDADAARVRAAYCFLEAPERTVVETYDEARLTTARERLEGLVAGIRAGAFERTDSPHRSLCYGCPAAARLCGAPAWRPSGRRRRRHERAPGGVRLRLARQPGERRAALGRPVSRRRARLAGWRRRWSQVRDNLRVREDVRPRRRRDGPAFCLGLNLEPAAGPGPERRPGRGQRGRARAPRRPRDALRPRRGDARGRGRRRLGFDRMFTFTAKPGNLAASPPPGAVILASYARAVEAAFESLGAGQLDLFHETTGPPPVEVIEAVLVSDRIPPGNPRAW